ncbi:hypothetical protein NDU88_002039 [Pleurodeles waltl]|uniref:Uncharacterized protein n=1 Tax=Pleurodeles waltl TaxID=8319 RepID=A0AAV7KR57_PLEWA|nr:hypothetical protein NDU88_002039 [Pleurodeles waltl]
MVMGPAVCRPSRWSYVRSSYEQRSLKRRTPSPKKSRSARETDMKINNGLHIAVVFCYFDDDQLRDRPWEHTCAFDFDQGSAFSDFLQSFITASLASQSQVAFWFIVAQQLHNAKSCSKLRH